MTKVTDKILTFKGGIHPPHGKELTSGKDVEACPLPETVIIPLQQHAGAPAKPLVEKGDSIKAGQKIGEADGFISANIHSSVSGTVKSIEPKLGAMGNKVMAVVIATDPEASQTPEAMEPLQDISPEEIRQRAKDAGLVGMGGAAFPTNVKLSPPKDKKIESVIINACECEPYLTCDHRLMLEEPEVLIDGLQLLMKAVGASKGYLAIEMNKTDAIDLLQKKVNQEEGIAVVRVATKYPQGSEKQLIKAITGKEVPSGGLPADAGALVQNAGTAIALSKAVRQGMPLIERVVTVTGEGIKNPKNLKARIGTSFEKLVEFCGGFSINSGRVIAGGPMTGFAQYNLESSVVKGTSGIVVLPENGNGIKESGPCIRCGKCIKVCPMYLSPSSLSVYAEADAWDRAEEADAMDCIECGCCSFVCPGNRPVVQLIKIAKLKLRQKSAK